MSWPIEERFDGGVITLEMRGMQHAIKTLVSNHLLNQSKQFGEAVDRIMGRMNIDAAFEKAIEEQLRYGLERLAGQLVREAVDKAAEGVRQRLYEQMQVEITQRVQDIASPKRPRAAKKRGGK